jgi:hypothetical protein
MANEMLSPPRGITMILTQNEEQALERMAELLARAEKEAILDEYEKLRDKVLPGILQVVQKAVAGGMICLVIEKTSGRKKKSNQPERLTAPLSRRNAVS